MGQFAKELFHGFAIRNGVLRQKVGTQFRLKANPLCYHERVLDRIWDVGKQLAHFLGRF